MRYIKDEEFIRGNCPMTKEDVRILSIAKLELEEYFKVLDIGAGTGSISIQACKICTKGEVTAIEMNEEALDVIKENKEKFRCDNLNIIAGEAMEVLDKLEDEYDAIFIGGSGGNLEDIIKVYSLKLKPRGKIVLNFITIDNFYKAMKILADTGFSVDCSMVSVSKVKGKSNMIFSNNTIFIVDGYKSE